MVSFHKWMLDYRSPLIRGVTRLNGNSMLGAIPGDIIGSVYEGRKQWMIDRNTEFEPLIARNAKFTDDTVMTIAVAHFILNSRDLVATLKAYANTYPKAGFGKSFKEWAFGDDDTPYNSYGNGSAMRVSPVAYAFSTLDEVLLHAKETALVTHNHPEGIKGAQAVAACVFLARTGASKSEIAHAFLDASTIISTTQLIEFDGHIRSIRRVRGRSRRRSLPRSSQLTTRTLSALQYHLEVTATRLPRSRVLSLPQSTAESRHQLPSKRDQDLMST